MVTQLRENGHRGPGPSDPAAPPSRVVLADSQGFVREGLRSLLEQHAWVEVVGEAGDGREAVQVVSELRPDLVVMDTQMPQLNAPDAIRRMRSAWPEVLVVAIAPELNRALVAEVLRSGADGYVMRNSSIDELLHCFRRLCQGECYLCPEVTRLVVDEYVRGEGLADGSACWRLTPREREVAQLLAEGSTCESIARQLSVSRKTVDTHRYQVLKKLNLRGMADLTRFAIREGLTSLGA